VLRATTDGRPHSLSELQPLVELLQRRTHAIDEVALEPEAHDSILTACRTLHSPSFNPSQLFGDWAVRWTSTEVIPSVATPVPLKLLAFGVVPTTAKVHVLSSFNCVSRFAYSLFHAVVPTEFADQLDMDHAVLLELKGEWTPTRPGWLSVDDVPGQSSSFPNPDATDDPLHNTAEDGPNRMLIRFHTARMHFVDPEVCGAKSSLGDAKSSLGDAKSSLGDAKSSLGDGC
jgi:hypothetical protein